MLIRLCCLGVKVPLIWFPHPLPIIRYTTPTEGGGSSGWRTLRGGHTDPPPAVPLRQHPGVPISSGTVCQVYVGEWCDGLQVSVHLLLSTGE